MKVFAGGFEDIPCLIFGDDANWAISATGIADLSIVLISLICTASAVQIILYNSPNCVHESQSEDTPIRQRAASCRLVFL